MPIYPLHYKLLVIDSFDDAYGKLDSAISPALLLLNPDVSEAIGVSIFAKLCDDLHQHFPKKEFITGYVAHNHVGKVLAGVKTSINIFFLSNKLASFNELQVVMSEHGKTLLSLDKLKDLK